MHLCLVATNHLPDDPRATALHASLSEVGHRVSVVSAGAPDPAFTDAVWVSGEPISRLAGAIDRIRGRTSADRRLVPLAEAAAATGATLFYPTTVAAVAVAASAADRVGGALARPPQWDDAGPRDLIRLAPHRPELSTPAAPAVSLAVPAPGPPAAGRHEGTQLVLCYRRTRSSPGRYLEGALVRAGVDVLVADDHLDLDAVPPDAAGIVVVESPLPPFELRGTRPAAVPLVFWVHHGEHHLDANVRLTRRYGAAAVLLAHSWHLAHRFPVPVVRFPFAVAPEMVGPHRPWSERRWDVAFVGRHTGGSGPYARRGRLLTALADGLPGESVAIREQVAPEEMAALYADARIVPNEGGTRHLPITMRVFEALGAGALLLTDPAPGLDRILDLGEHAVVMKLGESRVVAQVTALLDDPATPVIAAAGREHAHAHHTYDRRVDLLLAALAAVRSRPSAERRPRPTDPLAAMIDDDVDVQRLLADDPDPLRSALPDREVWGATGDRVAPRAASYDAVAITRPGSAGLLAAARRYVYAIDSDEVVTALRRRHPGAEITRDGEVLRADLRAPSYRILR